MSPRMVCGMRPAPEGGCLRGAAHGRAVRDPEPLGSGRGTDVRGARVRRRHNQCRARVHAGSARWTGNARRGGAPHAGGRPGDGSARLGRPRERIWRRPESAARAITRIAEAGAGWLDRGYDTSGHIYDHQHAAERVAAAAEAANRVGFTFTLTGRAELLIRNHPISMTRSRGSWRTSPSWCRCALRAGASQRGRDTCRLRGRVRNRSMSWHVPSSRWPGRGSGRTTRQRWRQAGLVGVDAIMKAAFTIP